MAAYIVDLVTPFVPVSPEPWPYYVTSDIQKARQEAKRQAAETGQRYAVYYRGSTGGRRQGWDTGDPWRDWWSVAPLALAEGRRSPDPLIGYYGPCEFFEPTGRHIGFVIGS